MEDFSRPLVKPRRLRVGAAAGVEVEVESIGGGLGGELGHGGDLEVGEEEEAEFGRSNSILT